MTRKIRLIEAYDRNCYLMRYVLTQHGYAVTEARAGQEGLDLAFMLQIEQCLRTHTEERK